MKIFIFLLILLFNNLGHATEQGPDYLYYKGQKISIYTFPLESRVKKDKILKEKLNNMGCISTAYWRHIIGVYEIENDSLFLIGLKEPCKGEALPLEKFFSKNEIKNGKIFVDWYSGEIKEGFGKYFGFSISNLKGIYEKQILIDFKNGIITSLSIKDQAKSKIQGAWGNDELGNALFAFYPDSIYYPDDNLRYKYSIKNDTIMIQLEDNLVEKIKIIEISDGTLKLNYIEYDKILIVDKRE